MPSVRIAGGLNIYYRESGNGPQTVLLIHGNVASSLWWERVMGLLPPGVRTVAPDLRGCGDSDKPAPPWSMADLAEDIDQFMEAVGLRKAVVVGHSLGGGVALHLAVAHPKAVEKLVLINPAPAEGLVTPAAAYAQIAVMAKSPEMTKMALAAMMPTAPKDEYYTRLLDESVAKSVGAWIPNGHALDAMNLTAEAGTIQAPTLIVYGRQDILVKLEMMERTRAAIPGGQLEIWDEIGHSAPVEAPERFARRLMEFIG